MSPCNRSMTLCMLEFCSSLFMGHTTIHISALQTGCCYALSMLYRFRFYSTMPFRLELFNCILQLYSVSCCISLSGVISWYILHLSIRRCMCFYVLSITWDRLVLCTLSVLRLCWNFFGQLCIDWHLPGRMKHKYWFYTILRSYMLLHMPPLLDGRWFFVLVLRFICSFMVFYIFCGVSSLSL